MSRRGVALGAVAIVLGAVLMLSLAWGLRHAALSNPPVLGRTAPRLAIQTAGGEQVRVWELQGKPVVLNFWASWCGPCRAEQPVLAAVWERYRDQGVVVLGVSFQDARSAATAFASTYGSTWPLVEDPGSAVALRYGVTGVPETFVIGPDGRIAVKFVAAVRYEELTAVIDRLLPGGRT